jgi:DNA invertase Pin-like site-specific DNA recombinase
MATGRFIAYYRVSTDRQGRSGLGLDGQREAVRTYLNGGAWSLVDEFTEIESGKRNDRPELAKALSACRRMGTMLVIAKLDRLARNVAFVSNLMEAGVEFTAVDFPNANRLTIHILAAVAEHEREMISQRTKTALAIAKARGVALGGARNPAGAGSAKAAIASKLARATSARAFAEDLRPVIEEIRSAGVTSLSGIAAALNERSVPTRRGAKEWQAITVRRALQRTG